MYISRLYYDVSVRLSVTEVHWRIIANFGFEFRSKFTAHCGRGACGREGRDRRLYWRDKIQGLCGHSCIMLSVRFEKLQIMLVQL